MIPGLHEAHVRVYRCRRAAAKLASLSARVRHERLAEVEKRRGKFVPEFGKWERELLAREMEAFLRPRRQEFSSRMDEVRKAVFG